MPLETPAFAPWLGVFETLRVVNGTPLFVREHLAELRRAQEALGLKADFDFDKARQELPHENGRWRWVTTPEGTRTLFSAEEPASAEAVDLSISSVRVGSANWDARFKTVSYLSHAQAAPADATQDAVLLNERGEIASASRGNLFWRRGGQLFTPAHEAGCRCGVVRGFVLQQERVDVGFFPGEALVEADEIFISNSVRGIISVRRFQNGLIQSSLFADRLRRAYDAEIGRQLDRDRRSAATSWPPL